MSVYITSTCMYMYQHVRLPSSHVYLSIQFDTNVFQLLRHVLSWSCDPRPSLGELSSSRLNRLSVCLSCLFWLCIPPEVYGRPILCLLCLRVALFSKGKKGGFSFFFKKMAWRQPLVRSDVRCQTSDPPHLTDWRQSRQLRQWHTAQFDLQQSYGISSRPT